MQNTTRTRIALAVLTIGVVASSPSVPTIGAVPAADAAPVITITAELPEDQALAEWALSRFELAGLTLPSLELSFHPTYEGCQGYAGLYNPYINRLDFCNRGEKGAPHRTMLHELAHAWSFEHMSEDEQGHFIEHRHLNNWQSADSAWWQMGAEQAAEIIAWGLQDENEYKSNWLMRETCEDLASTFEMLTGSAPLHTNTGWCK